MELFRTEVLLGRIVRLRNHAGNLKREVLELCCSEWFQNKVLPCPAPRHSFRAVLF